MVNTSSQRGQGLVEYAFLLTFIFLVVVVVLYIFGISVVDLYDYTVKILVEVFT